jgi:leucyl/phenylalanyl-tRNA--protein transferase
LSILYLEPGTAPHFPDPRRVSDALIAVGGDLSVERLLLAYDLGIFPWYSEHEVPLWWSPDPRGLLRPSELHVPQRLQRTIAKGGFELTWNRCFAEVMRQSGANRPDGTWIHGEMIEAYTEMHRLGHAHSLEVWQEGELVGGIYGVQRGAMFAAESKFHRRRDMSKVALVACARCLFRAGIELFDVQFRTPYLASLGVGECSRHDYLEALARARRRVVDLSALEPQF